MTQESEYRSLAQLRDLEVRLYKLTTRSHLRVGAGEGSADVAVENPLIRALVFKPDGTEERVPYIPGSSLHGVVRAWVEKALRSGQEPLDAETLQARIDALDEEYQTNLLDTARREVAEFLSKDSDSLEDKELYEYWQVYTDPHVCNPLSEVDKCERITKRESTTLQWKVEWWKALDCAPPCAVCRIFGYMGQRGRVKFSHAWPAAEAVPIDVITRVAINRLTGAADEGKLFDLEAIPPGVTFYFFVVLENMEKEHKDDFNKGLKALNMQLAGLGAHSTVGFGMVDVDQVFTATIEPGAFDRDVDKLIKDTLDIETETAVALDRLPKFFRALVIAHEQGKEMLLDGQIKLA